MVSKKKNDSFVVTKPNKDSVDLARKWLLLGISALALAGIFAVLLVFARTPVIQKILPWEDFFHTALVVHVDLSVLVWLLSFACCMWVYAANSSRLFNCRVAFYTSLAGMIGIAISPFTGNGVALMNNYVPILQNSVFFMGLSLFVAGVLVQMGFSLFAMRGYFHYIHTANTQVSGIFMSALFVLIATICFAIAGNHLAVPEVRRLYNTEGYFELLFWGGGHILQYAYAVLLVVTWLWLAQIIRMSLLPKYEHVRWAYIITGVLVIPTPVFCYYLDITSFAHIDFFTKHMIYGAGLAAIFVGAYLIAGFYKKAFSIKTAPAERNALLFSLILFFAGGGLGFMIEGSNVVIPAHYHGSIVGVTLAFMGITYHLLPKLGYAKIDVKLAKLQPVLYGGGQFLHIIGLAWSGGYGALRKTPGAVDSFAGQMGMGLMGLGGLLSVIGGLLFVVVAYKSIFGANRK